MVKGISRRVIVVRSPDPQYFEQAIFLLREDAPDGGVSAQQVLRQAKEVADRYLKRNAPARSRFAWLRRRESWLSFLAGAGVTGLVWMLARLLM
ncbi:MAG TPA: translation initiation factor 2 [Candidatus Onthomonas avicola]|nr:translation initiation factor 2 [Candidatus Onthomonas avicola]